MAPHEFVEIRLVCKADYLDPQLKSKLHEIRDKLRELLHTGRRRFALKKVQPWNSVKVTLDIPKEAADRLRLLAVQGNARLIELGILSVEIVGQSAAIVVNSSSNGSLPTAATAAASTPLAIHPTTNSLSKFAASCDRISLSHSSSSSTIGKDVSGTSASQMSIDSLPSTMESTPSSAASVSTHSSSFETKTDDHHRHKRVKLENDSDQPNYPSHSQFPYKDRPISSTTINLMQSPSGASGPPIGHYAPQQSAQLVHRQPTTPSTTSTNNYGRISSHANSISPTHATYLNSGKPASLPPNNYAVSPPMDNASLSNGIGNEMHGYHHHHHHPPNHHHHQQHHPHQQQQPQPQQQQQQQQPPPPPHESWSVYPDHSNNYKMKVNGVRSTHYYPQQQQLILSDNPSSSTPMFFTQPPQPPYDMRRCETSVPPMAPSTTNMSSPYVDGSSTGLSS